MTKLIMFLITFVSQFTFASYTSCPAHTFQSKPYTSGIHFLSKFNGAFKFGGCQIEMHICKPIDIETDDNIVGDLLIVDKKGRQQYITLLFPQDKISATNLYLDIDDLNFKYEYVDRNPDDINGYKQKSSLEIELDETTHKLKNFKMSTYSSNVHDKLLGVIPVPFYTWCWE